jgi:hypothetical protein
MKNIGTGKHHKANAEGLRVHYPDTCNVLYFDKTLSIHDFFGDPSSATSLRFAPSSRGIVAILYETKGYLTFFIQTRWNRAAWQRIEWKPDYEKSWKDRDVLKAMQNFLWVAECEDSRMRIPRPIDLE